MKENNRGNKKEEGCGCAMCQLENPSASHHEEEEEPTEEKSGKWKTAGKIVLAAAALLSFRIGYV